MHPREAIKKEDGIFAYYVSAQFANLLIRLLGRLPLLPNHFTLASLIVGIAASIMMAQAEYLSGVILLNISFIFDCADGQWARWKQQQSRMGHWFDYHSDKLKDGLMLFGLALGIQKIMPTSFTIAFVIIFFQFLRNITALNRDLAALEITGKKDTMHSPIQHEHSQLLRAIKHSALFKLSDRVLLITIFALFGKLWIPALLILYAALECFYAFVSAFLNYRTFQRYDRKNNF